MKKYITILFALFFFKQGIAQTSSKDAKHAEIVKIMKTLAYLGTAQALSEKDSVRTFSLKLKLKKNKGSAFVSDILFTDSIGYTLFPNINRMKTLKYDLLVGKGEEVTLLIPILVFNSSKNIRNPEIRDIQFSLNSFKSAVLSLFYPDTLQERVTIFPVFYMYSDKLSCGSMLN
ncbi:hypothetical protein [Pedobacter sp. MW01-1-1]|uniref:hypothetical protein n=1 Tax=Pedobacter sp. MW01-1-1 TaxID=3383027 RepID=UPI003FEDA0C7